MAEGKESGASIVDAIMGVPGALGGFAKDLGTTILTNPSSLGNPNDPKSVLSMQRVFDPKFRKAEQAGIKRDAEMKQLLVDHQKRQVVLESLAGIASAAGPNPSLEQQMLINQRQLEAAKGTLAENQVFNLRDSLGQKIERRDMIRGRAAELSGLDKLSAVLTAEQAQKFAGAEVGGAASDNRSFALDSRKGEAALGRSKRLKSFQVDKDVEKARRTTDTAILLPQLEDAVASGDPLKMGVAAAELTKAVGASKDGFINFTDENGNTVVASGAAALQSRDIIQQRADHKTVEKHKQLVDIRDVIQALPQNSFGLTGSFLRNFRALAETGSALHATFLAKAEQASGDLTADIQSGEVDSAWAEAITGATEEQLFRVRLAYTLARAFDSGRLSDQDFELWMKAVGGSGPLTSRAATLDAINGNLKLSAAESARAEARLSNSAAGGGGDMLSQLIGEQIAAGLANRPTPGNGEQATPEGLSPANAEGVRLRFTLPDGTYNEQALAELQANDPATFEVVMATLEALGQ